MKKKFLSVAVILSILCTFFFTVSVEARSLSAIELKQKLESLKSEYPTGWKWEDGWCVDYTTGNCGPGYKNAAWECMGFAYKICNELFEEDPRSTFYQHSNVNNLCVGDYVRRNGHSFVVTNISGNTVYYVDCNGQNGYGYNVVCWERSMSKSALVNGLEHIKTQYDNWVKTLDDITTDSGCKWQVTGTDGINIRSGPGTSYAKVGAIAYQEYFTITRRKSEGGYTWGAVTYGGVSGWCVLDYAKHISGTLPTLETGTVYDAIHKDSNAHISNGVYTFKNVQSGLVIDVSGGSDTNGNIVTVYGYNSTKAQKFRAQHNGGGKYYLYAMCSSDGNGRVLDVMRTNNSTSGALQDGCYVDIYNCNDPSAQLFYIYPVGDGKYVLELDASKGRVISPADSTAASNEISQLYLKDYIGADYQKWYLCDQNGVRIDRKISSVAVKILPTKTEYFIGDKFNSEGVVLNVGYSDGSYEEVKSGFDLTYDFGTAGTKEVILNYKGMTTTVNVRVQEVKISNLALKNKPSKTSYYVGDTLDTSGLELTATYNNGSTKTITSEFTTSYDFGTAGTKSIKVSYEGLSVTYDVTVENVGSAALSSSLTSTAVRGDEITYVVDLKNAEGVYDGNYNIIYDNSALKYKSHTVGAVLSGQNCVVNPEYSENGIRITFAGLSALKTGNMLSVAFEVIADTETTTQIKLQNVNMYNQNGKAVSVSDSGLTANCNISKTVQNKANELIVNQNNSFNVTLKSKDEISGILILAWYDNNDCLLKVKIYPATDTMTVPFEDVASTKYVRFMWWDSLNNLKPLAESKKLSVS